GGKSGRPAAVLGDRRGSTGVRERTGEFMSVDLSRRLGGKIAVVTGGGSGIGLASARRLHAEGATMVIGDIDERTGTAAADELGGLFVPVDVSDEASVNGLYDTAVDRYGSIENRGKKHGHSPPRNK